MMTGIPVRTLRFYHEVGLLIPAAVDAHTNYRSYDERNLELAKVIVALRGMEFKLEEIHEILAECGEDADVLGQLDRQKKSLTEKVLHYQKVLTTIDQFIDKERRQRDEDAAFKTAPAIEMRRVDPILVAGYRMQGNYDDCGKGFAKLGKLLGRQIAGKPLCLFYDGEYREGDANFETCFPIRKLVKADGISVHELPAIQCLSYLHRGPYTELRNSYGRLMKYVHERGYKPALPTREVYLKGPGMIFFGNPRKFVTEIQIPIDQP
jgi:DNA-binding transcriptional MerR regulator